MWKDLFPAGTQGKPGVCWLGSRGVSGFYLDGSFMGRAESIGYSPLSAYDFWFFKRKSESPVFPYEGFTDGNSYEEPRVRREWLYIGETMSRLITGILTNISKGEIVFRAGEKREDICLCVVRGIDGTERIMFSSDADLRAVTDLMDSLYTVDVMFGMDEDYLLEILKKYDVLKGVKKSEHHADCADKYEI